MTDYWEVLAEPSYHGQILVMTFPYIGNFGTHDKNTKAAYPLDSALVVEHFPMSTSSYWTRISQ